MPKTWTYAWLGKKILEMLTPRDDLVVLAFLIKTFKVNEYVLLKESPFKILLV